MSDLISRSDLIEAFDENDLFLPEVVKKLIENQPTAYDVDKVVTELDEAECSNCSMYCADANVCGHDEMRKQAIDIVKRGGVDG